MAKMMSKHTPVICSFITPYERHAEKIFEILPEGAVMAHVSTSSRCVRSGTSRGSMPRQGQARSRTSQASLTTFDHPDCADLTLESSGEEGQTVDDMSGHGLAELFEKPMAVLLPGSWQPLMWVTNG